MTEQTIPQVLEINCETGVEVLRPMTTEELALREESRIAWEAEKAAQAEKDAVKADLKASAKAKLVAGTPLTEEEAETIVL